MFGDMAAKDKKELEDQFTSFVKEVEELGLRWTRFDLTDLPAVISIDDRRPEQITIKAHVPTMTPTEIGHVFATGKDGEFAINDIYVGTGYFVEDIRAKLLEGALSAIEKHDPALIDGKFEYVPNLFRGFKETFKKYGFAVSLESDKWVNVFKEYPKQPTEQTKNQ